MQDDGFNWFGDEKPIAELRLIRVSVEEADYWDKNTSFGHRIKKLMTGSTESDVEHERISWSEPEASPTLSLMGHHKGASLH